MANLKLVRRFLTVLTLILAGPAWATVPMSLETADGIDDYCITITTRHNVAPELQPAFCNCVVQQADTLHPATRQALIIMGNDPDMTQASQERVGTLMKPYSAGDQKQISDEMQSFFPVAAQRCAAFLQ